METMILAFIAILRAALLSGTTLAVENAALRRQLTVYQRNQKPPRLRIGDRVWGVVLRRLWSGWARALIVTRPAVSPDMD